MEEGVRESALVADGEPWSRQLILAGLLAVCMTLTGNESNSSKRIATKSACLPGVNEPI